MRRAAYEPDLIDVEEIGPPPYESSSLSSANAPVPPHYSHTALTLESPQPSVLASSSSHDETSRASSSQHVEEVTTPPAQAEIERSKHQPREFNATRRVPSTYSSVPTSRKVGRPYNIYQVQLSSLYHGFALWEPSPIRSIYDQVSIGDVGYINEGFFYRLFNVTLPWDHPSNFRLGEPDHFTTLNWDPFANIRRGTLAKGDYHTPSVSPQSSQDNSSNMQAREPHE